MQQIRPLDLLNRIILCGVLMTLGIFLISLVLQSQFDLCSVLISHCFPTTEDKAIFLATEAVIAFCTYIGHIMLNGQSQSC